MASVYPGALDSLSTTNADATTSPTTHKNLHNDANDAINKIEAELGISPSDTWATVKARLDAIYTIAEATNIVLGTTTGTKIGTSATQKLGFYNATPVVQNTGWAITNVTTDKTFDANATSLDELADTLGTLINVLKTAGIIGA